MSLHVSMTGRPTDKTCERACELVTTACARTSCDTAQGRPQPRFKSRARGNTVAAEVSRRPLIEQGYLVPEAPSPPSTAPLSPLTAPAAAQARGGIPEKIDIGLGLDGGRLGV